MCRLRKCVNGELLHAVLLARRQSGRLTGGKSATDDPFIPLLSGCLRDTFMS